ncbi:gamma-glutamylcyclotransferase family protein [Beijerinckia indica]|uniref:AIG2 family protein n=1 Tax=Beijerinckia indica subsp. indica (strain ATCC 9039 / DSM 1715 / NCIMB 8712) TaxID=395963 RepID=B2IIC0_BEII9|nr:gamma-glutamylcyclotransferase family protein [Beijerinckia indica]ACB96074.1 AIG2 family protein [Beijerinckia indica subsp. indica ATCC 9039]
MIRTRIRWRRLTAKSWTLSRLYYRFHKVELAGRPSDKIWYFAYGSNMHDSAFLERRGMRPLEWRVGRAIGYRLRFNLDGRPLGKAAPANICADVSTEVWGVLYQITCRDMLRLNASEGVPGKRYRPTWLSVEDGHGRPVKAMTYIAEGNPHDGRPSLRYLSLLREGARAHGLPDAWVQFLESVEPAE